MNRQSFVLAATAFLICASSSGAFAQTLDSSPYAGLFEPRRGDNDPAIHHRFDLNLSLVGAHDDDVLGAPGGVVDPVAEQATGFNTTFVGSFNYSLQRRKVQLGASANSSVRYYSELQDYTSTHAAGLGVSVAFAQRSTLSVNQSVAYSPPYLYGLFPSVIAESPGSVGSIGAGGANYLVNDTESYAYESVAGLTHGFTRRGSITASARHLHTDFAKESPTRRDVSYDEFHGAYQHTVSRTGTANITYRFVLGDLGFGGGKPTREHGLTIGYDYTKRLSPSRRVIFHANMGSSVIDIPESIPFGVSQTRRTGFTGDAALDYHFGRSWQARASYRRGLEYVADVTQPVIADGATAQVSGQLSRRVDLLVLGGLSKGESALRFDQMRVNSYTGDVRLRFLVTRTLSTFAEYLYYFYDFSGNISFAPNLVSRVERNGVRVGVTVWLSARRR
jgi:hypothetical protein